MMMKSGLDAVRDMIARDDATPMGATMNLRVASADDGTATVEALPHARFNNSMGLMHGGFVATLIDSALGCAVMTKLAAGVGYGTVELKVNYVRKVEVATGTLRCTANVLHAGRTMFTAEAKVVDAAGVLYAHGSGTFLVYPK